MHDYHEWQARGSGRTGLHDQVQSHRQPPRKRPLPDAGRTCLRPCQNVQEIRLQDYSTRPARESKKGSGLRVEDNSKGNRMSRTSSLRRDGGDEGELKSDHPNALL